MADEQSSTRHPTRLHLRTQDPAVDEDALASFNRYWNSMRQDGDVPLRTHIDPRGIESLLGNAFIAERVAPGFARLRIAGAHLAELMGMEVRGMPISTFIDPQDRDHLSDTLVELFERPATVRIDLAAPGGLRRPHIKGTLLILPLRSDLGDISRALGCLVTSGVIDAVPRRFGITSVHCSPIDVTQPAPPVTSRTSPRHASERPWLKLVHST